jgi:hypothetical protein|tara:strand:- start:154 stop:291 length:138 start_codon:yes stop_codon:yes gene_type:complete
MKCQENDLKIFRVWLLEGWIEKRHILAACLGIKLQPFGHTSLGTQ